jgi:hypothetical protein
LAAARAALLEVWTEENHGRTENLALELVDGCAPSWQDIALRRKSVTWGTARNTDSKARRRATTSRRDSKTSQRVGTSSA